MKLSLRVQKMMTTTLGRLHRCSATGLSKSIILTTKKANRSKGVIRSTYCSTLLTAASSPELFIQAMPVFPSCIGGAMFKVAPTR